MILRVHRYSTDRFSEGYPVKALHTFSYFFHSPMSTAHTQRRIKTWIGRQERGEGRTGVIYDMEEEQD